MSYNSIEISVNSGKPIELYDFFIGANHYRYTSGPDEVTYMSAVYAPERIERESLELTDNNFKNQLELHINRDNVFIRRFIEAPLEGVVCLTIYRGHGADFVTFFIGTISAVTFNSDQTTIICTPRTSSMLRTGLRRKYQKLCNWPLFGYGCQVTSTSYRVTSTIATISNTTVVSGIFALQPDGYYTGGKLVVGDAERLITSHAGSTITISRPIKSAVAGNSFYAYAGCDHTMDTCRLKFNNLINYGGQPWIPVKNPFGSNISR